MLRQLRALIDQLFLPEQMADLGHATAKDVRELIAIAQKAVEGKFGHHLEPEIGFVGES